MTSVVVIAMLLASVSFLFPAPFPLVRFGFSQIVPGDVDGPQASLKSPRTHSLPSLTSAPQELFASVRFFRVERERIGFLPIFLRFPNGRPPPGPLPPFKVISF